jgi:hypothetical protein
MTFRVRRMTAGYYEMCAGGVDPARGYIVTITRRDDLRGWIAAARWDRFLYEGTWKHPTMASHHD